MLDIIDGQRGRSGAAEDMLAETDVRSIIPKRHSSGGDEGQADILNRGIQDEGPLNIAQVSPLCESVPPKLYGGTERVVSYLTEALVQLGHNIVLYASGDSVTSAALRPMCPRALRLDETSIDAYADHVLMAEKVFQDSGEFDVVHSHIDYTPYPLYRRMLTPRVTTLHGHLHIPNLQSLYREFKDEPVVSISDRQRAPLAGANWQGTVYHGLPADLYRFHPWAGKYLAFVGRVSPEKGVDDAIRVANRAGVPLKIAAKVDKVDREYFEARIKPLLGGDIEFIGEIGEHEKNELLGGAAALIFMIDWEEPFGLALIEALACGTPAIVRDRGSAREVIQDGQTGYVIRSVDEAVQAVEKLPRLSRADCRKAFEERFTAERMARDYVALYRRLVCARQMRPLPVA